MDADHRSAGCGAFLAHLGATLAFVRHDQPAVTHSDASKEAAPTVRVRPVRVLRQLVSNSDAGMRRKAPLLHTCADPLRVWTIRTSARWMGNDCGGHPGSQACDPRDPGIFNPLHGRPTLRGIQRHAWKLYRHHSVSAPCGRALDAGPFCAAKRKGFDAKRHTCGRRTRFHCDCAHSKRFASSIQDGTRLAKSLGTNVSRSI